MWSIRFLTGPQAGQIVNLREGSNILGRAPQCDIVVANQGVSKEHLRIEVFADKVIATDLGSRNGSFVNGVQFKSRRLSPGDRIGIHDVVFEITDKAVRLRPKIPSRQRPSSHSPGMVSSSQVEGSLAKSMDFAPVQEAQADYSPQQDVQPVTTPGLVNFAKQYFEKVVMPGVYKMAEWMEFRWVIGLFVGAFIVIVTLLSSVPLMRILEESVERESSEHAVNLARFLADKNAPALKGGFTSSLSTAWATETRGVDKAYLLDATGLIIAPPELAGQFPSESFVNSARKQGIAAVEVIGNNTVAAVEPIRVYSANLNDSRIQGYAVVIYNMATLSVSSGRTLSLLIQVFVLALILGGILYVFFVKLIEHPLNVMNQQVKDALRDGKTQVAVTYQFPQLQELATNINSAVQRALSGDMNAVAGLNYEADRALEMQGLLNVVGFAAAAVNAQDMSFAATNSHFQDHISRGQDWVHTKVESILEQSLRLNLLNLLDVVQQSPQKAGSDELEINGTLYTISAQGIMGAKDLAYVVFVFMPKVEV